MVKTKISGYQVSFSKKSLIEFRGRNCHAIFQNVSELKLTEKIFYSIHSLENLME